MPRSRPSRRNPFRRLFLESLQNRQLMAADLADAMEFCGVAETTQSEVSAVHARAATAVNATVQTNVRTNSAISVESPALHFSSESDVVTKLTQMAVEQWGAFFGKNPSYPYDYNYSVIDMSVGLGSLSIIPRHFSANSGVADSTGLTLNYTNVQTSGVDEADNAAISGDGFAFVFRDQVIRIIDINDPANLKEVSRIELPGQAASLHLVGNKLVVISQGFEAQTPTTAFAPPNLYYTQARFFDVTNRAAPVSTGSINLSGSVSVSRIVNGQLVLVQNTQSPIPVLETINSSDTPDWWTARYETKQEYLARVTPRILQSTLVKYQQIGPDGKEVSSGVLGDWRDIANAGGTENTTVIAIDLNEDMPKPTSMESVLGGWVTNTYVTEKSIYLTFAQPDGFTRIVHLDLGNVKSGISANGVGDVKGAIRNSRFMDEFDGYLRVVTSEDGSTSGGRIRNSANVFVMQVVDDELKTVGSLLDISPGDQAYSVEFDGERALVTTGFLNPFTNYWRDPLHGIDLSDPTQPKELSDVVIPGINSYVHWVDSKHLVGVGMVEEESLWYTQVSLYDVTDLSDPKTIDVWRSTSQVSAWNFGANLAMDIRYDAESKTLTIPQSQNQFFQPWLVNAMLIDIALPNWSPIGTVDRATSDVLVLSIDADADKPIMLRAEVGDGSGMGRAVVVGDTLVALTNVFLSTYATDDPTKVLDRILLANPLRGDFINVLPGTEKSIIHVLENDFRLVDYKITAIKGDNLQGSVRILADQRLEYTNPTLFDSNTPAWVDSFEYEVTTSDGAKFTTFVSVYGQRSVTQLPIDASVAISLKAEDDDGNAVTSIAANDEFWVEVLVKDGRERGQGVFATYVDLAFDTGSFEIVGEAEHMGFYTNGVAGEKTSTGWKNLGGFSNSPFPIGSDQQSLVRFRLRATKDAALNLTLSKSYSASGSTSDITLYGVDVALPNERLSFGSLQLPAKVYGSASIALKALDAENYPVTSSKKGDEFWIEVNLQDERSSAQGVYSAYVDIAFDTSSFEIVGDAESMGDFTNKVSGEKTSDGWRNLGGFRNSTTPAGAVPQSLVRFKVRATEDAVLAMTASPSNVPGSELTLYGIDTVIPIANITAGSLQLPKTPVVSQAIDYDVNADGIVSPIDSLIVINRLNREIADASSDTTILASSGNIKLDVNQDGIVSLLDVLSLVNRINQESVPVASASVAMMDTVESGITKKK